MKRLKFSFQAGTPLVDNLAQDVAKLSFTGISIDLLSDFSAITNFQNYSNFVEKKVLDCEHYVCLEFVEPQLTHPYPNFVLFPENTIQDLKSSINGTILSEEPSGHVIAINGFTKTGKSTLAQHVLPSFLKMHLATKKVNFRIAFISFEISKDENNGLGIANAFRKTILNASKRIGCASDDGPCSDMVSVISSIHLMMNDLHTFAQNNKIRVLFVMDEVQRFFQSEDYNYAKMVDLFKFICLCSSPSGWRYFFFVITGSGMAEAWRGFKSASVQGLPLFLSIRNVNIESNTSIKVQSFVYEKFNSTYNCFVPKACFLNPACIAMYCSVIRNLTHLNEQSVAKAVSDIQKKLLIEISTDLLPLLRRFTQTERKTVFQLTKNVCPDTDEILRTSVSYFEQFLKRYDTGIAEHFSRFKLYFPHRKTIPSIISGIGYDYTYTSVILTLLRPDGTLVEAKAKSLETLVFPVSLQTMFIMHQLMFCGEKLNSIFKDFKTGTSTSDPVLSSVETAVQAWFGSGVDISQSSLYSSMINFKKCNSNFQKSIKVFLNSHRGQNLYANRTFPYYGICFLIAFRNCHVHSDPEVVFKFFQGKDVDIMNLARAIKSSGELSEITCYMNI